jgi:hypothetical protein
MRILKENTLGLVIDVQERLFPHIYEKEILEKNIKILISGLKLLEIPVLVTEQYSKGLGFTIPTINEILPAIPIEKISFSCCDEPVSCVCLANCYRFGKTRLSTCCDSRLRIFKKAQ